MKIGILNETDSVEKRVSIVPESIKLLAKNGHEIFFQSNRNFPKSILKHEIKMFSSFGNLSQNKLSFLTRKTILSGFFFLNKLIMN